MWSIQNEKMMLLETTIDCTSWVLYCHSCYVVFHMLQCTFSVLLAGHMKRRVLLWSIVVIVCIFSSIIVGRSSICFYPVDFCSLKIIFWFPFTSFLYAIHEDSINLFLLGVSFLFFHVSKYSVMNSFLLLIYISWVVNFSIILVDDFSYEFIHSFCLLSFHLYFISISTNQLPFLYLHTLTAW